MKWTIHELRKHHRTNNSFEYVLDCNRYLGEDDDDLVDISPVNIQGTFFWIEQENKYLFDLKIKCVCTMLCAITLDEVEVPLSFSTTLEFANEIINDFTILIEGVTIDLDPYVWAEILVEKPMKVVSKNAYDHYLEDIVVLDQEELSEDNPFAKLKQQ